MSKKTITKKKPDKKPDARNRLLVQKPVETKKKSDEKTIWFFQKNHD